MASSRPPHEKHMGSYSTHVWQDAVQLAYWVKYESGCSFEDLRARFAQIPARDRAEYATANQEVIGAFIQRTASQRPAFLRRIAKENCKHPAMSS